MTTTSVARGRITARVHARIQETLEIAANMTGDTVNQFIVQTALREAERIIERERVIRLSISDAEAFLCALDSSPAPNAKLLMFLHDYTARRNDQAGTLSWTPQPKRI